MHDGPASLVRRRIAAHCGNLRAVVAFDAGAPPRIAPDLARWPDGWSDFAARLIEATEADPHGRIWFPGNPYPGGHRLEKLSLGFSLAADRLDVDVRLNSARYDEESTSADTEVLDDVADWQSVGVWTNYNSCDFGGTITRTAADPVLDLSVPLELRVDPFTDTLDHAQDDLAFWQCYILGHDSIADHHLCLSPNEDGTFQLVWDGRVAMTYVGGTRLDHAFLVEHASLPSIQLTVAADTPEKQAREWLARYVADASTFTYTNGAFHLGPSA